MKTQKQKLAEFDGLDRAYTVAQLALFDALNGETVAIGRPLGDGFQIWISRPDGAAGGIAMVREGRTVVSGYFEELYREQMERFALCLTGENNEFNRALLARRERWEAALAHVRKAQHRTQ